MLQQYLPFTVLKLPTGNSPLPAVNLVATVLTVYGIETTLKDLVLLSTFMLQQYLPFTVLKRPFLSPTLSREESRCNSTYRLRYWN